jgi:thiamine-phosphate pyrophosphorylase
MKIKNGIYIIIDPSMERNILLNKLKEISHEDIAAIQIWDNFNPTENPIALIEDILETCHARNIPVLINNQWDLLKQTNLDGIHFDEKQENILQIKNELNRQIITGITCNNDLSLVKWADKNEMDYISFCSMFPSSTANSCDLVNFKTIHEAAKITNLPIFLAGGIKPGNIEKLNSLLYSGIAVVSGIMNAEKPRKEIKRYTSKLKMNSNEN